MDPNFAGKPPMAVDLGQMRDTPNRRSHHRRAHSDISYRFDDLLLFDPSDLDLSSIDLTNTTFSPSPTPTPGAPMASAAAFDSSDDSSSGALNPPKTRPRTSGPMGHFRSLSVDSDFFDGLGLTAAGDGGADEKYGGKAVPPAGTAEKGVYRHRHSNSMDGSATTLFEGDSLMAIDGVKKAMAPDRLAELSLIDPKRAKRILANRQSAARSKERKVRYTSELERKVQTLQTEATTLSAQVTMLQRDTTGMTSENKELKMRLQAMEQQAQLREALNDTLKEEVQRLKIATGQIPPVNGNPFNRGIPPQFSSHQSGLHHHFGGHQTQQYQQQQQQQLQMPQSSANNQTFKGQPHPSFLDFNQRV